MSGKQEAAYHGADIVTRLRLWGPDSDYNGIMGEAADEIERLRGKADPRVLRTIEDLDTVPTDAVILSRFNVSYQCMIAGNGNMHSVWAAGDIVRAEELSLPALLLWTPDV